MLSERFYIKQPSVPVGMPCLSMLCAFFGRSLNATIALTAYVFCMRYFVACNYASQHKL